MFESTRFAMVPKHNEIRKLCSILLYTITVHTTMIVIIKEMRLYLLNNDFKCSKISTSSSINSNYLFSTLSLPPSTPSNKTVSY